MSLPTAATLRMYGPEPPDNDTDPIDGADIDYDTPLDNTTGRNLLIGFVPILPTDQIKYGIGAYKNTTSGGNFDSARMALRGGMKPNSSSAVISITSTSPDDAGKKARLVMKTGGGFWLPDPEIVTMAGLTAANSINLPDVGGLWRVEALDAGGAPSFPVGNWTIAVDGEILAIIYGTAGGASQPPTLMATLEYRIALAVLKDTVLTLDNRDTPPDEASVSAFSHATRWAGADTSLSVPGGGLDAGEKIEFVIERTIPGDIAAPLVGYCNAYPSLIGYPVEV